MPAAAISFRRLRLASPGVAGGGGGNCGGRKTRLDRQLSPPRGV